MIPTPTCSDAFTSNLKSTQQKPDTMHSVSLAQLCEKMPEKMWPTPTLQEIEHPEAELTDTGRRKSKEGASHSLNLADSVNVDASSRARLEGWR